MKNRALSAAPDQLWTAQHNVPPLLTHLLLSAPCKKRVRCLCMTCGPRCSSQGCVHARTCAKKPPVISFPSAAPSSSSRERPHHLLNTMHIQLPSVSRAAGGWGTRIFPGGHDSNLRLTWQLWGLQRRRSCGQAGCGWTEERKTTHPRHRGGTQGMGRTPHPQQAGHHKEKNTSPEEKHKPTACPVPPPGRCASDGGSSRAAVACDLWC